MAGSIKEIAKLANVSRGTVDRVLHNRYGVSEEVRKRVSEVIKELDYQPNAVAKALKSSQEPVLLGVILPPLEIEFFREVIRGLEMATEKYRSYGVKIYREILEKCDVFHWKTAVERLMSKNIQGLMTIGIDTQEAYDYLENIQEKIDIVIYNTDLSHNKEICFVGQDHFASGKVAGSLMGRIVKGNGKIFTVMLPLSKSAGILRFQGFRESICEKNSKLELLEPVVTDENPEFTYQVIKEALQRDKEIVGIFINDSTVVAAAKAIEESGRGKEIAVISYDLYGGIYDYLDKEIIDYTITQEPFYQGYFPIQILYDKIVMGKVPKYVKYHTLISIRCKENQYCESISTLF